MYLEATDLGKTYDDVVVIEHTDIRVEEGESLAFASPSGSGKSTLLSMLGLLLDPTSGRIVVDGRDVATLTDDARSEMRLRTFGFVFQHTQLIGSLRAWENVATPARFASKLDFDPRERAMELLCEMGLEDRLHHYPFQLSVGQKRRVALARALIMQPPILIADEPTNDLDSNNAASVTEALFEHVESGGILLYASHDQQLLSRATRIMHLDAHTFK